jgi:GAF domain-containing protein
MPAVAAQRVAEVFVEVADTLVEGFDLVDFLYRLTERTTELSSAAATGLLLADVSGRLQFMAASDERAHLLELFHVQADEGPCRDCYRTGESVIENDLTSTTGRWPGFGPLATEAGFRSVHAFPLRLRGEVLGALGVFSTRSDSINPTLTPIVQALADVATIALLQERTISRGEVLTEQLQNALNSRIVIEQAKGALAYIYNVSVDEAFVLLRTYVRRHNLPLTETARTIAKDPVNAPDLTALR